MGANVVICNVTMPRFDRKEQMPTRAARIRQNGFCDGATQGYHPVGQWPAIGLEEKIKAQKNPGKTGVVMPAEGVGWADEYTPLDSNQ